MSNYIITFEGLGHLQTNFLEFQFYNITTWDFLIHEIDSSSYVFVNFANRY